MHHLCPSLSCASGQQRQTAGLELSCPVQPFEPGSSPTLTDVSKNMKKRLFLIPCFVLAAVLLQAQVRETRDVPTFTKLSFRGAGKLYLRQGSPQKVELEGTREILDQIETKVEGNRLVIGPKDNNWRNWNWKDLDKITAYVTVKDISAIDVSGSGDLVAQTKLFTSDLKLSVSGSGALEAETTSGVIDADVSGSGNMKISGRCTRLKGQVSGSGSLHAAFTNTGDADLGISGSGNIRASGNAQTVTAEISGSGKIMAADLEADRCVVSIGGSGDVEINVKRELQANIAGSGSVSYRGNPSIVNTHSAGSGRVRKM